MTKIPPVAHDDTQGQLGVVISFRMEPNIPDVERFRRQIETMLWARFPVTGPVSVGLRLIGAQGERSEIEGANP